jgi:hypothetical protein
MYCKLLMISIMLSLWSLERLLGVIVKWDWCTFSGGMWIDSTMWCVNVFLDMCGLFYL